MFQVYNHSLQKTEYVEKIDLNKHWKAYLVPFDSVPEETIEEEVVEEVGEVTEEPVIEEIIANATPKPRGRPKAN
jgi:hypothetical protein